MRIYQKLILSLPLLLSVISSAAPVTISGGSTVLLKRVTPSQLNGPSSGVTTYSSQCTARTVTWSAGSTCTAAIGPQANSVTQSVSSTNGNTGSASFKCDGTADRFVLMPGSACSGSIAAGTAPCASQSVTWGSCSATAPSRSHALTASLTDSTAPSTGNATFTCNDGTFTYNSGSCTAAPTACTSKTLNWSVSGNACASVSGTTNDGSNKTLSNTASNGNTGSATYTCNAASDSYSLVGGSTCSPTPPTSCTSQTLNWASGGNACGALSGATGDGTNTTLSSTSSNGNTGNATYSCVASSNTYSLFGSPTCNAATQPTSSNPIDISISYRHVCILSSSGAVRCAGLNPSGELGDGTKTDSPTQFVDVAGLSSGVSHLLSSHQYTCALTNTGGIKCWGENGRDQLGDGTRVDRSTPVNVSSLTSGATKLSVGDISGNCAINAAGGIRCWGAASPVYSPGPTSGIVKLSSVPISEYDVGNQNHRCAVTNSGGALCWGNNSNGQLGNGQVSNTTSSQAAVPVSGLSSGVSEISTGTHYSCALMTSGGVKCWGHNFWGQLGDGTTTDKLTPVDVIGLSSGVSKIFAGTGGGGGGVTCALLASGGVKCWGLNSRGDLGDGTNLDRSTPVDVLGLTSGVAQYSMGYGHSCVVTSIGGAKCWGRNMNGALGDQTQLDSSFPVDVSGLTSGVLKIATGMHNSCALLDSGEVRCWGAGYENPFTGFSPITTITQ